MMVHRDFVGQMLAHPAHIVIFGRAVDDHVDAASSNAPSPARDHQVVEYAAILVQQQRIAHALRLQFLDIARQQRLKRGIGTSPVKTASVPYG
jgi:hypothetical protein